MKRMKTGGIAAMLLFAVAILPGTAFATWSAYTDDGTNYGIREGDNKIMLGVTEKQATKTAHRVNKALSKDKPFVDPGSGPCHDPRSGVLC